MGMMQQEAHASDAGERQWLQSSSPREGRQGGWDLGHRGGEVMVPDNGSDTSSL